MKYVYGIAALFMVVSGLIYWLYPVAVITDLLAVIAALMAFGAALYTWQRVKISKKEGLVWLLLSLGIFLWLMGETLWLYLEAVTGEPPFPSAADYCWLLGYPVLFLAFYSEYRRLGVTLDMKKKWGAFLLVIAAGLIMVWVLLYDIASSPDVSSVEKFLDIAYPIGDLALFCVVLLVSLVYLGGRLGRAWLIISLGFVLHSFADLAFSYLQWEETYWSGHPIDLLWLLGYSVVFVGAYMYRHAYEKIM